MTTTVPTHITDPLFYRVERPVIFRGGPLDGQTLTLMPAHQHWVPVVVNGVSIGHHKYQRREAVAEDGKLLSEFYQYRPSASVSCAMWRMS